MTNNGCLLESIKKNIIYSWTENSHPVAVEIFIEQILTELSFHLSMWEYKSLTFNDVLGTNSQGIQMHK